MRKHRNPAVPPASACPFLTVSPPKQGKATCNLSIEAMLKCLKAKKADPLRLP